MIKTKVIDILKKLSPEEMKQFRDFVRSPYHNKNKNVIRLFESIRKYSPTFDNVNLTKEIIFKKLYPGKEYNDIVMRILFSDLMRISEDFLVQKRLERSVYDYKKLLLQEFMERKIDKLFLKTYKEADYGISEIGIDDSYFKFKFDIEELNKGLNIDRNMQHLNSSNLVDMGMYLIIYFLTKMSSIIHDISVNIENFNTGFEMNSVEGFQKLINLEGINKIIKNKDFKENEILELYFCAFMINTENESEAYYCRLKELFYNNISRINRVAAYNMYLALLNYNGKKHWRDKENKYRREQLEIFKDMLQRGIYSWSEDEYMTIINFRSILTLCSMLKEIDWMEYFIDNYIDKLDPVQRDNIYHFSYAKLNFAKRNYKISLEHINKVNINLFTFKFDIKTLTMQIFFELGYLEEAYAMIDSFRHFLTKNKNVSQSFKEWNMNFISIYNDLINYKLGKKKPELDYLKLKIIDTPNTASQNWLLSKTEELNNNIYSSR